MSGLPSEIPQYGDVQQPYQEPTLPPLQPAGGPVDNEPAYEAPGYQTPAYKAPAYDAPVQGTTPSKTAPGKTIPSKTNGNAVQNVAQNVSQNVSAAASNVANHPVIQDTKKTLTTGPVAQNVKAEAAETGNQISGLANSRQTPKETAATGQALTHYHSFFYTLLSWKQPRATAISFATSIVFIFACRYLPLLRWIFKISYVAFGVTALAEGIGRTVMGTGVAASFRPRKYYRIPKETLETLLDDVEQLINFFVIEFQRVLFAENVTVTAGAFLTAFVSYYLVKILPVWGLTLLSTGTVYLAPLIYIKNKSAIDSSLEHASNVVSAQTAQIKGIAGENANRGFESVKAYTGDYAAKAQDLIGQSRQKIPSVADVKSGNLTANKTVNESQFPTAPKGGLAQQQQTVPSVQFDGPAPVYTS